jgi:hypothetical protein
MNNYTKRWITLAGLVIVMAALLITSGKTAAQDSNNLSSGSIVAGTIGDQNRVNLYTFNGAPGDLMTAQVIGTTPGMDPTLSLLSPTQRQVTSSNDDPYNGTNDARISFRLTEGGTHSLLVSGTNGGYLLRFNLRGQSTAIPLTINAPTTLSLGPGIPPQLYSLNVTNSFSLVVNTNTTGLAFVAQVFNPSGRLAAILGGPDTPVAEVTLCGAGNYQVVVSASDVGGNGSVSILASPDRLGLCSGDIANPPATVAPLAFTPPPQSATNVCVATSLRDFDINLRRGPSLFHGIIGTLGPRNSITISGRNLNGTWYVNVENGRQAWVAANLITLNGPCGNLLVIQAPPAPFTFTPPPTITPIIIILTATPYPRTATPFVVTSTPIVITATPIIITATPIVLTATPTVPTATNTP